MKNLLALSTLALLTLTGCGTLPTTPTETIDPTEAATAEFKMEPMEAREVAPWQDFVSKDDDQQPAGDVIISGDQVVAILSGSSSCPPVIEKADIIDTKIEIELKEAKENMACTADLVFYGFKGVADEETLNTAQSGEIKGRNGETKPLSFTRMPVDGAVGPPSSSTVIDGETSPDITAPGPNELDY